MKNIIRKFTIPVFGMLFSYLLFSACTVIREVGPEEEKEKDALPPKVIDMLVLVELGRGTTNLTEDFGKIIGTLRAGLEAQNISVRKAAMAPMYRQSDGVVPIVFGENDPDSDFSSYADALLFYTRDAGTEFIPDKASSDIENLAILGANLDQRAVYHPESADPDAIAYFESAKDGFLVVHLAASPRRCAASDSDCTNIEGTSYSAYFTQEIDDKATWLTLPGKTGLPADKIVHAVIATAEGIDYDEFREICSNYPNFPATKLDVMEPSEKVFFNKFVDEIEDNGGTAEYMDLCEAMSKAGEVSLLQMSAKIRTAF